MKQNSISHVIEINNRRLILLLTHTVSKVNKIEFKRYNNTKQTPFKFTANCHASHDTGFACDS